MSEIFASFLQDVLAAAFTALDNALLWMLDSMLHVETLLGGSFSSYLNASTISAAYSFIYTVAGSLVVLKFLFKGFQIYILWRDGDADSSPQDMIVGSVQAIVVIALFPSLYEIMADVTLEIAHGIIDAFSTGRLDGSGFFTTDLVDPVVASGLAALGIFELILLLIFVVLALVFCIKMIGRGFELLVLRLGVPIACAGLVDSDFGMFKGYMQIFYKSLFTSIIQIVLLSLAFRVISGMGLIDIVAGISIIGTAFAAPTIMQQILVPTGRGGGITQKMYATSMTVNALRTLTRK